MPKRKTADANLESAVPEPTKRSSAAKPKTSAAATHKRTTRIVKAEVATPVVPVESVVENSVGIAVAQPQAPQANSAARTPEHEEIAMLAYSYWEQRGYQGGSPEDDWFRAERELLKLA